MTGQTPRPRRYKDAGKRRQGGQPFHRRHRSLIVSALAVVLVLGVAAGGYAYMLNSKLSGIGKVATKSLDEKERPDPDKGRALNILLLGSDKGKKVKGAEKTTLTQDARAATWPNGKYRSDTLMIVHVSADRKHIYLVSVPRDTFTMLYDADGKATHEEKINGAFSYYGPAGAISTIEHLTDLRMKHLAIIDWDGFRDLSRAVGGVRVYIPYDSYDIKQKKQWTKGWHNLQGNEALQYVRTRYGLVRGDFERIERQQNFLRQLMKKMLSKGTLSNPVKLTRTLSAFTANLTVDEEWTSGDIRALALSLRGTSADDVSFMTLPVAGTTDDPTYGSVVQIDEAQAQELYEALRTDKVAKYIKKYPDAVTKAPDEAEAP